MSKSTQRWLIIGNSGSGKSTLANEIITQYRRQHAVTHLVMQSTDAPGRSDMAAHARKAITITRALADKGIDYETLIRRYGSIYVEYEHRSPEQMDALSAAVLKLGNTLVVTDEAQRIKGADALANTVDLHTRGRKFGVHTLDITLSLKQRKDNGVHPVVLQEATTLITFSQFERHNVQHVTEAFPELSAEQLRQLKNPLDGLPEYAVRHNLTGRSELYLREQIIDISGGAAM